MLPPSPSPPPQQRRPLSPRASPQSQHHHHHHHLAPPISSSSLSREEEEEYQQHASSSLNTVLSNGNGSSSHSNMSNSGSFFPPRSPSKKSMSRRRNNNNGSSSSSSNNATSSPPTIITSATSTNDDAQQQHQQLEDDDSEEEEEMVNFLDALSVVDVPEWLLKKKENSGNSGGGGVPVILVYANGKTELYQLSLTRDKFTVQLTPPPQQQQSSSGNSSGGGGLFSRGSSNSNNNNKNVRSIDIGEMDRVQRGQSTQQFEKAKKRGLGRGESSRRLLNIAGTDSGGSGGGNVMIMNNNSLHGGGSSSVVTSASGGTSSSSAAAAAAMAADDAISVVTTTTSTSMASSNNNNNLLLSLDPERSFSIIFRGAQTLDLMATSQQARDEICDALDHILHAYQRAALRVASDVRLLRFVWLDVVGDRSISSNNSNSQFINVHQITRLLSQINLSMKPRDVQSNYDKFGKVIGLDRAKRRRGLTFEQLADFLHYMRRNSWLVKPVTALWNELFGELMNNGKKRESVSERTFLQKFLHEKQGQMDATLPHVRQLFKRLHGIEISHTSSHNAHQPPPPHPRTADRSQSPFKRSGSGGGDSASSRGGGVGTTGSSKRRLPPGVKDYSRINKDQFEAYLLDSSENDAFSPSKERLDLSCMHKPLSEYFINSSHNTYLIGDQYTSHSRVEMYSNALYRGCRCLELDIWDGGKSTLSNGTTVPIPVVWHGHTMTTKILFVDIIRTIKVFLNFHPDTFPIVLSFENHCSIPYQQVMAQQLESILGSALYIPTEASLLEDSNNKDQPPLLPSPAQLRGMVVIKGRRPSDICAKQPAAAAAAAVGGDAETEYGDSDDESVDDDGVTSSVGGGGGNSSVAAASTTSAGSGTTTTTTTTTSPSAAKPAAAVAAPPKRKRTHVGVAPELARLTLLHGTKFKTWNESVDSPNHHMHSFSESKVRSRCRHKEAHEWIVYNQTHMSRTYPAGSRVDSSNYNPLLAWSTGCQMVALNFQTQDAFLRLNDGRFRENGNCGYVLKPSSLMVTKRELEFSSTVPIRLTVQVLSGSCLPKPKGSRTGDCIDPYIRLSVFDVATSNSNSASNAAAAAANNNNNSANNAATANNSGNGGGPGGGGNGNGNNPSSPQAAPETGTGGGMKETVVEYATCVVRDNGFHPVWDAGRQEYFEFVVETWAAAMLQLTVLDKNGGGGKNKRNNNNQHGNLQYSGNNYNNKKSAGVDAEFVASCSIPISCLRRGIRSVKLYDATNTRSGAFDFASLLLDINMCQVIAEI